MNKLDKFIDENYDKVMDCLREEGRCLGYNHDQLDDYASDCKCFIFAGELDELQGYCKSSHDCWIIAQQNNLVIAEMFNGLTFNCI